MVKDLLLEIKDLWVNFYTYRGVVKALNGVNLKIYKGEFFGLVGETGCGKSVTALVNTPSGCRFHPRCDYVRDLCKSEKPKVLQVEKDHMVACFLL